MYNVAIEKKISPVWNFVFGRNITLQEKANKYLNYNLMNRYKNEVLIDRLKKDSIDFREWADVKDVTTLTNFIK